MPVKIISKSIPLPRYTLKAIDKKKKVIRQALVRYSQGGNRRFFPWRERNRSPYEILIAETLLKRTTATAAARIYEEFLLRFPSPQKLYEASKEELAISLSPIGLQQQRASTVKKLAQYLVEKERGKVPDDLEALLQLPSVGDYSARAILSFAYGTCAAVVDSNVIRIFERVFKCTLPQRPNQATFQSVVDCLIPCKAHREFNLGLLDLGALICKPVGPRCEQCPLRHVCDYGLDVLGTLKEARTLECGKGIEAVSEVRRLRKEKGLSLVELSKLASISKLTLIKIESGKTTAKLKTLEKISRALGVTVKEISH